MTKYYIDTCIWRDYFENRNDRFRPLGDWTVELLNKINNDGDEVAYSDAVIEELLEFYSVEEIARIFSIIPKSRLIKFPISIRQVNESKITSVKLKIPRKDVLHAILARDNNALLVSRDNHFSELTHITIAKKPEELI